MSQNGQEKPAEEAAETSAAPKAKGKAKAASARGGFNQENIGSIWVTLGESSRNGWTCEVNNYELFRFMGLSGLYHTNKEFKRTIYGEIIWIYWRSITLWNQHEPTIWCIGLSQWDLEFPVFRYNGHNWRWNAKSRGLLMIQTRFKGTKVPYFNMFNGRLGARAYFQTKPYSKDGFDGLMEGS